MSTNDNIWDDQNADEMAGEIVDDMQQPQQPDQYQFLNQEVVLRIERTKLYDALLRHDLISDNSASPEIVESVRAEIKSFIIERIETLMGIKAPTKKVESPFTPDEIKALKLLASKITSKISPVTDSQEPALSAPAAPAEPVIKIMQAKPRPPAAGPSRSVTVGAPKPPQRRVQRRKSANVSKSGKDYSQAGNPSAGLPMPSQDVMNAHIAAQASKVLHSGKAFIGDNPNEVTGGSDSNGSAFAAAIASSLKNNK